MSPVVAMLLVCSQGAGDESELSCEPSECSEPDASTPARRDAPVSVSGNALEWS